MAKRQNQANGSARAAVLLLLLAVISLATLLTFYLSRDTGFLDYSAPLSRVALVVLVAACVASLAAMGMANGVVPPLGKLTQSSGRAQQRNRILFGLGCN